MSNFSKMVDARRAKTGESHAVAARQIRSKASDGKGQGGDEPTDYLTALSPPQHVGDILEQHVLTGPWTITYWLNADESDVGFSVGGAGPAALPGWVIPTAKRYARLHKATLVEMLHAARHGEFHVSRGGVVAGSIQTDQGEIGVWFTSWNDDRPVVSRTGGIDYEVAQSIAVGAFRDVPDDVRKRLFRIARPFDAEGDSVGDGK